MLNPSVSASEFVTPEALCSYLHCLLPSQAHRYIQIRRALCIALALLVLGHMRARRPGVELPMLTGAPNSLALVDVERMRDVRAAAALNNFRVDHSFSPLGGWRSATSALLLFRVPPPHFLWSGYCHPARTLQPV